MDTIKTEDKKGKGNVLSAIAGTLTLAFAAVATDIVTMAINQDTYLYGPDAFKSALTISIGVLATSWVGLRMCRDLDKYNNFKKSPYITGIFAPLALAIGVAVGANVIQHQDNNEVEAYETVQAAQNRAVPSMAWLEVKNR